MKLITKRDRAAIKKLMLRFKKVADANKKTIDCLVDGFLDQAIDYQYAYVNMRAEIYYYLKELGWS